VSSLIPRRRYLSYPYLKDKYCWFPTSARWSSFPVRHWRGYIWVHTYYNPLVCVIPF